MNHLRIFYTDGTTQDTSANSSAASFEKYLTQNGRTIVTAENDQTGKETRKTIAKVELIPAAIEAGDTFTDAEGATVTILQIYTLKDYQLVQHQRTTASGFIYTHDTRIEIFNQDIADGELNPIKKG